MTIKLSESQKKAAITGPDSVASTMQQILKRENKLGRSQEHFWVVGLNNANKILFIELIGLGRQNRVTANPPDVFRMAIYKLALKVILVHNHPSGELHPSTADRALTDRIIKVGEIINIDVIDHLIITEKSHLSFADLGIIAELKASDTWRLIEKEELEMRRMKEEGAIKNAKKDARKEEKLEVAKKLKEGGMEELMIKKYTGLSVFAIKKL